MDEYIVIIKWLLMAACGLLTHFCKHLIKANSSGSKITWSSYWTDHKPETVMSVVGTVVLFFVFLEMDAMNSPTAFSCGFMGNSVADLIGNRAAKVSSK